LINSKDPDGVPSFIVTYPPDPDHKANLFRIRTTSGTMLS
jgi:hypothetical protein